jgi:hypothetical protein
VILFPYGSDKPMYVDEEGIDRPEIEIDLPIDDSHLIPRVPIGSKEYHDMCRDGQKEQRDITGDDIRNEEQEEDGEWVKSPNSQSDYYSDEDESDTVMTDDLTDTECSTEEKDDTDNCDEGDDDDDDDDKTDPGSGDDGDEMDDSEEEEQ